MTTPVSIARRWSRKPRSSFSSKTGCGAPGGRAQRRLGGFGAHPATHEAAALAQGRILLRRRLADERRDALALLRRCVGPARVELLVARDQVRPVGLEPFEPDVPDLATQV